MGNSCTSSKPPSSTAPKLPQSQQKHSPVQQPAQKPLTQSQPLHLTFISHLTHLLSLTQAQAQPQLAAPYLHQTDLTFFKSHLTHLSLFQPSPKSLSLLFKLSPNQHTNEQEVSLLLEGLSLKDLLNKDFEQCAASKSSKVTWKDRESNLSKEKVEEQIPHKKTGQMRMVTRFVDKMCFMRVFDDFDRDGLLEESPEQGFVEDGDDELQLNCVKVAEVVGLVFDLDQEVYLKALETQG